MLFKPRYRIGTLRAYLFIVFFRVLNDRFNQFSCYALPAQAVVDKGMVNADSRFSFRRKGNFGDKHAVLAFGINSIFLPYKFHSIFLKTHPYDFSE